MPEPVLHCTSSRCQRDLTKKKKCGAVETHRTVRLYHAGMFRRTEYRMDLTERESAILLPTVVRLCHRDFAGEGFFDAVRILLNRLVSVEEVVEQ